MMWLKIESWSRLSSGSVSSAKSDSYGIFDEKDTLLLLGFLLKLVCRSYEVVERLIHSLIIICLEFFS